MNTTRHTLRAARSAVQKAYPMVKGKKARRDLEKAEGILRGLEEAATRAEKALYPRQRTVWCPVRPVRD